VKIAVCHNQPTGGARRALHGFCSQLKGRHSLHVFTLDTSDDEWLHDADVAETVHRNGLKRRNPIRLGLYLNDLLGMWDQRDLDVEYASMAQSVDSGGFDVALVDVCRFSLVPSVLDHLQTPSVFYAHNGPAWLEGDSWAPPRTGWERARDIWHRPVARVRETSLAARQTASVRAASLVVTNSQHTADRLRLAYGVDPMVCPPGTPLPVESGLGGSSFVLSVGEIEPRKGFGFLIDALGRMHESVRPPLRVLANRANPTELARITERARRGGVSLDVLVAPDANVLAWHYANARVFVYAPFNEPLGLAPLEAMAYGTPVVAVREGGVPETVNSGVTGYLVERDADQFAQCLERLFRDDASLGAMRRAARAHVEKRWEVANRAEALEQLLLMTAQSRGAVRT
jgi:glycosyltransferase involved in cell wall biosynthesis